jgi:hypothetical protein
VGQDVTFSVFVDGSDPLTYQWRFNGADIPDATDRLFKMTGAQAEDAGSYSVRAATEYHSAVSSNAILTIRAVPVIVTQPHDQTVLVGQTANFTVSAAGTLAIRLQPPGE